MSNRPISVLVVTSIYPTKEDPGLGAFVSSQIESLRKAGLKIDILFLDARRSKWELLKGISRIRRLAASGDYDLIHAHFGYNGIPACFAPRLPLVISFCGTDLTHYRLRPISRWVARRADAAIVKSEGLNRLLGRPASIIPNGVELARFRPTPREEARRILGLRGDLRYVLFVGNPRRPEKRYDLAERVVARAQRSGTPFELLVLDKQPHTEVPNYLNAADVLLITSSYEGSPNIVKESMACNLPIVSTDVGDIRKILTNTRDCLVDDAAPESLAKGLLSVTRNGTRSNGRSHITHLSSDTVASQVIGVYRRVLEARGRA